MSATHLPPVEFGHLTCSGVKWNWFTPVGCKSKINVLNKYFVKLMSHAVLFCYLRLRGLGLLSDICEFSILSQYEYICFLTHTHHLPNI